MAQNDLGLAVDEESNPFSLGLDPTAVTTQASSPTLALPEAQNAGGGYPMAAPAPMPSLALGADTQAPAPVEDRQGASIGLFERMQANADRKKSLREEYISGLSGTERAAVGLREVGAALQGKSSPLDHDLAMFERDKQIKSAEMKANVDAIMKGAALLRKTTDPDQREAIKKLYGETLPPQLRPYFEKLANTPRGQEVASLLGDPRIEKYIRATVTDPEKAEQILADPQKLKHFTEMFDREDLPNVRRKLDAISKSDEFKRFTSGKRTPSFEDLRQANEKIADPRARLTENEMATLARNQKQVLPAYGLFTEEMIADVLKQDAEKTGTRRETKVGKEIITEERQPDGSYKPVATAPRKVGGDETDAAIIKRDRDTEMKLADDFARDSKGFKDIRSQFEASTGYLSSIYPKGDAAPNRKAITPAQDRALIFAYAKMLDPGDKVAVKDVQDIEKLGIVPERFIAAAKSLATGKLLPDRVRQEMYGVMQSRFRPINAAQQRVEKEYTDRAGRYNVDHRNVVIPHSVNLDRDVNPADFGGKPAN